MCCRYIWYVCYVYLCVVGTFGKVYHGTLIGEEETDISSHQQVFVKTVTGKFKILLRVARS